MLKTITANVSSHITAMCTQEEDCSLHFWQKLSLTKIAILYYVSPIKVHVGFVCGTAD
jgi:hypothetical protein